MADTTLAVRTLTGPLRTFAETANPGGREAY